MPVQRQRVSLGLRERKIFRQRCTTHSENSLSTEKDKRVQINVKYHQIAKSTLDRLTRARKTTQQAILEQLILNGRLD